MQGGVLSLFGPSGGRKYLNQAERVRFAQVAADTTVEERLFCLTLLFSGGRISEILAINSGAIDLEGCAATIQTLKRRKPGVVRQVPLPPYFVRQLDSTFDIARRQLDPASALRPLWPWSRTTAWRRVKGIMAKAGVVYSAAMPKGLRHSFGVNATARLIPLNMVQRWLGHASMKTTSIYCDVCGPEEQELAARMWTGLPN